MTTTVRFHAGVHTSGGTIIELRHNAHRLVFDFGFEFNLPRHVFDGTIRPGGPSYLSDLFTLGMLPAVDGVFASAALGGDARAIAAEDDDAETMVLISHPHEDHVGAINVVARSVPVVMSEDAAALMGALRDAGEFTLTREVTGIPLDEVFSFGPFEIVPRYSDHPAWGSVGFEITTPDGRVFWTGDWRLHGKGRERALAELEAAGAVGIDLLILEGTSLGSELPVSVADGRVPVPLGALEMADGLRTEEGVDVMLAGFMREPGIIIANTYLRDFSPLRNLFELAASHGRSVAVQPETALVLERLTGGLPPVYVGRGAAYSASPLPQALADLVDRARLVTAEEVLERPSAWVLQLGYAQTPELLAFAQTEGVYLHIGGTPLGGSVERSRLERVLQATRLTYSQLGRHTHFAHATPSHIELLTRVLDPRYTAVVHAPYEGMAAFTPSVGARVDSAAGVVLELQAGEVTRLA